MNEHTPPPQNPPGQWNPTSTPPSATATQFSTPPATSFAAPPPAVPMNPRTGPRWSILVAVIAAVAIGAAGFWAVTSDSNEVATDETTDTKPTTTTDPSTAAPETAPPADPDGGEDDTDEMTPVEPMDEVRSVSELAEAVVLLVQLDADGRPISGGSGTVIDSSGLILTNAHVVESLPRAPYEAIAVGFTTDPANPPDIRFLGTVVAFDAALDLAMVQITENLDGSPAAPTDLPTIPLGDSDTVDLGEQIRILGYPGIGGDTITLTTGSVSGFTSQAGVGSRAWIKTDATIAGGNSGGLAFNDAGELVGVPTLASAGESSSISDCRFVEDTNGDNVIDENDSCIPIGGFINGVRPVNLATDIIEVGRRGEPVPTEAEPVPAEAMVGATITNLRFSSGITDLNRPVDQVEALPATATQVCAVWDFAGMVDGAPWDALWTINGQLAESISFIDERWTGGPEGRWWVCANSGEQGTLPIGTYDIFILVDGDLRATNAVTVG